jgi:hypothetical protein
MNTKKIFFIFVAFFIFLFLTEKGIKSEEKGGTLRAGIAKIDITPDKPVMMSGYAGRKDPSTGVHDNLYARAVAFENNGKRLVLVSTDLIGFYGGSFNYCQKDILSTFNLEPSELLLAGIHTHSAPTLSIDKEKGYPNNLAYTENLKNKLIDVIREALNNLNPVQMGIGTGYSSVGANRREMQQDGSIRLGRNPYGLTDKEVLVMKIAKTDGAPIGIIFDYATHATSLGQRNLLVSGDVLGLSEQFVENIIKGAITPAFAGASGNIDPWFRVLPAFNTEPGWIPEPVLLGTLLGEEVVSVFRSIKDLKAEGEIKTSFATLDCPRKKSKEDDTEESENMPINITAARIGDAAFIGFSVEMVTDIGMAIKAGSPYKNTFIITHCNGASGYLVATNFYKEGGYEVQSTPFAPHTDDMVIKTALRMLYDLK